MTTTVFALALGASQARAMWILEQTSPLGPVTEIWLFEDQWGTPETSDVTVTSGPEGITFVDKGASHWLPFAPCTGTPSTKTATCPLPAGPMVLFISTGPGDDKVTVSSAAGANSGVYVFGGDGNDTITDKETSLGGREKGQTVLNGEAGNDTLKTGVFGGQLWGGPGADKLTGSSGTQDTVRYDEDTNDRFDGTNFGDNHSTYEHSHSVTAGIGGGANDGNAEDGPIGARDNIATSIESITGTNGNDTLTGDADGNALVGQAGNDQLNGGAGADSLYGGRGNDLENGQNGDDFFGDIGGGAAGPDYVDRGSDVVAGGAGADTASYSAHPGPVTLTLDGTANDGGEVDDDTTLAGDQRDLIEADVENLTGSNLANQGDTLVGDDGPNVLNGLGGNDFLVGSTGNDTYTGGPGADKFLDGSFGIPEGGNDTFNAQDGFADTLRLCGTGNDTVFADAIDLFPAGSGCEGH